MRALIDTNVLISVLLSTSSSKPPAAIIDHAFARTFELLLSETTIAELRDKVATKRYLSSRLSSKEVTEFVRVLSDVATILPELAEEFPALSGDRKDDHLLFHAVTENANFLVSGDKDLLVLRKIDTTRIVSPAEVVAILEAETTP